MKHTIFVIMVLVLSSAVLPAFSADITHNFHTKFTDRPQTLTISDNKIGNSTNDGFTYTCGGKAEFGYDHVYGTKICIKLLNSNDYFTVSPAIDDLATVSVMYISKTKDCTACTNIKVYISSDGSTWGSPLPASRVSYHTGFVTAIIPKGKYFIKILNSNGSNDLSITTVVYTPVNCNCNTYIPE